MNDDDDDDDGDDDDGDAIFTMCIYSECVYICMHGLSTIAVLMHGLIQPMIYCFSFRPCFFLPRF